MRTGTKILFGHGVYLAEHWQWQVKGKYVAHPHQQHKLYPLRKPHRVDEKWLIAGKGGFGRRNILPQPHVLQRSFNCQQCFSDFPGMFWCIICPIINQWLSPTYKSLRRYGLNQSASSSTSSPCSTLCKSTNCCVSLCFGAM